MQGYSKVLPTDDKAHALAVGLLERFVSPGNEMLSVGYYYKNTSSSLRRLATELKKADRPEAAANVRKMRRVWAE